MAPPLTGESLILTNEGGDYDDQTRCVDSAMPHDRHGDGSGGQGHAAHVERSSGESRQGMLMIIVKHAPGGSNPAHRRNAHAMVYVLEGSVVMQVKGGKQVTLTPGQAFYEGPDDVHVVDRNASSTKPAKFLVVLIKDKGAPALVPVK